MKKVILVGNRRYPVGRSRETHSEKNGPRFGAVATSIFLAVVSAAIGYTVNFVDAHRKDGIKKVDTQIEKLYGPLYAYSVASRRAWDDLHTNYRAGKIYYFNDDDMPSAELVEVWRRWMKNVFMPLNLKMEAAIVDNAQLIDGNRIYPCFVDLISHVESYKATIASWKDVDDLTLASNRTVRANNAVIEYPIGLDACIEVRLNAALARRDQIERSWLGLIAGEPKLNVPSGCQ